MIETWHNCILTHVVYNNDYIVMIVIQSHFSSYNIDNNHCLVRNKLISHTWQHSSIHKLVNRSRQAEMAKSALEELLIQQNGDEPYLWKQNTTKTISRVQFAIFLAFLLCVEKFLKMSWLSRSKQVAICYGVFYFLNYSITFSFSGVISLRIASISINGIYTYTDMHAQLTYSQIQIVVNQ